jgi:signal transduction histidine kinase
MRLDPPPTGIPPEEPAREALDPAETFAERELADQRARLSLLYELTDALSAAHTPVEVARAVLEKGRAAFGADGGALALPVRDMPDTLELVAHFGYPDPLAASWRRFSTALASPITDAYRTGVPVWLETREQAEVHFAEWLPAVASGPDRSWAGLPLEVEGRRLGALGLTFWRERTFSADDRALFLSIAQKCALALDRARLWEAERDARAQAEHARQRAELLASMVGALNSGTALEDVLRTALVRSAEILHGSEGSILLLEEGGKQLRPVMTLRPDLPCEAVPLADLPSTQRALAEGRPMVVTLTNVTGLGQALMAQHQVTSALAIPLIQAQRRMGVMYVAYSAARADLAPDDLGFVQAVADQCALAIGRADIYETELEARARAEVLERDAQLSAERVARLQDFTAALSSAVTMKDVAQVLFERGLEELKARAIGIMWMLRPGKLELIFGKGVSEAEFRLLDEASRRGERLPIRDSLLSRQPVWLETPEEIRERYPVLEPLRAVRGDSACAVVPLVVGEWCPGIIGLTFDKPRKFSAAERSFIDALAQLSAQAFDRARLFEAEQEARRDAERVSELQERLMAIVGHDLRTPLAAITMASRIMFKRGGLPAEQGATLAKISNSAARMSAIIRDLLDFGRTRRGVGISIHCDQTNLGEVAQRALLEFEEAEHGKQVVLELSGDVSLYADAGRLAQVISNLVGNALQHGQGTTVRISVDGQEREVALVVHNDGPPIPPAVLPHIFEPFQRGHAHDLKGEKSGSIGLGLFIVREVVKSHGGSVEVRSDETGTDFTVRLPRGAPAE